MTAITDKSPALMGYKEYDEACAMVDALFGDFTYPPLRVEWDFEKYQPDVIITHSPDDYMPDHVAVSHLVFDASFAASVPNYKTAVPGKAAITPIYYMDNLAGVNFMPTEYVDISDTIETKMEMLECHESQLKWMRDHDHIDFAEFVRTCARFRGLQCGVQYAEAFRTCVAWPKVVPARLLP